MDVDEAAAYLSVPETKKYTAAAQVELKPDDPFDLEAYIAPYTDRRRVDRLLFIARSSPTLRVQAYRRALQAIKQYTLDYRQYQEIANECKEVDADEIWAEDARVKQESGMEKLDVELKNYQNNLIKESIRMGYRDIGDFQRKSGDLNAAVRSYTKSKDYCTTSQHIFDMSLSVVDTALDQLAYSTVKNYAVKAESALGHLNGPVKPVNSASAAGNVNMPGMLSTNIPGKREEETRSKHFNLMGEKLAVSIAVANLGFGDFEKAARGFLNVSAPQPTASSSGSRESASTNTSHFISPGDIGLYGILCGMASLNRDQFKRLVLDNANIRPYLEHNAFLKDVILKYYNSKFLSALQILETNMSRLLLDIHLSKHVNALLGRIKDKMVELYFEPFRSVKIDKMASAFGWEPKVLEMEVLKLIQRGDMKARIDTRDRTIQAYAPDDREMLYQHALKVAESTDRSSRAMAFRMRLIQNDLVIDAKKDSTQHSNQQQANKPSKGSNKKEKGAAESNTANSGDAIETIPA